MDKYQLLEMIYFELENAIENRGTAKCLSFLRIKQMLDSLKEGLETEDKSHQEEIDGLKAKITSEEDKAIAAYKKEAGKDV